MTEPKFTPGPWVYAPDYDENDGDIVLNSGYEKPVAIVFKSNLEDTEQYSRDEVIANSHLIATAPEMYWALWHQDVLERHRASCRFPNGEGCRDCKELHQIATRWRTKTLASVHGEATNV